jgi:hypothetical protein
VKKHLAKHLEAKRVYWKQRATIRFVRFGDENTKVFHAMATYSNRKNHISQLFLENDDCLSQHHEKAEDLWSSYKNRLGISAFELIHFNLSDFIHPHRLPVLDNPFSPEEIKDALSDMPSDHAPGPDGFNGMFMKKCCSIIQDDFDRLFGQFCSGNLNIEHINGSYITSTITDPFPYLIVL